jgi:hypothetical protein
VDLRDTSTEVRHLQVELYRGMMPEQRVAIAIEMSEAGRQLSLDGIRARRPELDDEEVVDEYIRIVHSDEAADHRRSLRSG